MKIILTLSYLLVSGVLIGQVNLDAGLVAYYPFEGNANDFSINAIHGTASGEAYSIGVYGVPDSSILFDGSSTSFVDCGPDNRGISDTITISAFVRTTFNGIGDIVSKYDPGNDRGYHFQISLGNIRLAGRDGGGSYHSTGFSLTTINDSAWHHILGVVRGNTWLLYVDCNLEGAQSNTTVGPDISSNAELGIGKDVFSDQKYLDCEVDEVRIYNRELTQDEMDSLCWTAAIATVDELSTPDYHLQVYPNPASDIISIAADHSLEESTIEIYDLGGKMVLIHKALQPTPIIDISSLESGQYIIKIIDNNQVFTQILSRY